MKYYKTLINLLVDFIKQQELLTPAAGGGYWLDNRYDYLEHFFNETLFNKSFLKFEFNGGDTQPTFIKNESELKDLIFKSLINYFESEAEFLKMEVEEFENLENWDQK